MSIEDQRSLMHVCINSILEHCGASDEYEEIVYFGREVVM